LVSHAAKLSERVTSIEIDSIGNIYVGENTNGNLGDINSGYGDIFLVKYDSSGNFLWVNQLGSNAETEDGYNLEIDAAKENDLAFGITIDSSDNIYIGGITFGNLGGINGGEQESVGSEGKTADAFIVKFDSSGNYLWIRQLGKAAELTNGIVSVSKNDYLKSITTHTLDNIYIAGGTEGDLGGSNGGGKKSVMQKREQPMLLS